MAFEELVDLSAVRGQNGIKFNRAHTHTYISNFETIETLGRYQSGCRSVNIGRNTIKVTMRVFVSCGCQDYLDSVSAVGSIVFSSAQ